MRGMNMTAGKKRTEKKKKKRAKKRAVTKQSTRKKERGGGREKKQKNKGAAKNTDAAPAGGARSDHAAPHGGTTDAGENVSPGESSGPAEEGRQESKVQRRLTALQHNWMDMGPGEDFSDDKLGTSTLGAKLESARIQRISLGEEDEEGGGEPESSVELPAPELTASAFRTMEDKLRSALNEELSKTAASFRATVKEEVQKSGEAFRAVVREEVHQFSEQLREQFDRELDELVSLAKQRLESSDE